MEATNWKQFQTKKKVDPSVLEELERIAHIGLWEWEVGADRIEWSDELFRIYGVDPAVFASASLLTDLPLTPEQVQKQIEIISDTCSMFEHLAEAKNQTLVCHVEEALPIIRADRERILQVFSNLLSNSIRLTPVEGTISLRAETRDSGLRAIPNRGN